MKELLLNSALLAVASASFSVFLEFCLHSGNILGFWGDFINRDFESKTLQYLAKPFGACIYCFSSWVFIVFYIVVYAENWYLIPYFIGLFAGLGFNHIILLLLTKIEN